MIKTFKVDEQFSDMRIDRFIKKAVKNKLNVICYDCKFSPKGIKLNRKINIRI